MNNYHINNDKDYTMAFDVTKKPHKAESISWIVISLGLFFLTLISVSRITVVGQFFDDVLFSFPFGWYKHFIYLILLFISMCIFFGLKFKFKSRFILIIFITFVSSCFLISAILYTIRATINNIFWSKNIFNTWIQTYIKEWKLHSVFSNEYKPQNWIVPNKATYFNVWAGGGIVGLILTAIFSYLTIFGALIIAIICFILNIIWIVKGSPFYYFVKKEKRVRKYKKLKIIKLKKWVKPYEDADSTTNNNNEFLSKISNADITIEFPSFRYQALEDQTNINNQPTQIAESAIKSTNTSLPTIVKNNQNLFDFTDQFLDDDEQELNLKSLNLFANTNQKVEKDQLTVRVQDKKIPDQSQTSAMKVKNNQFTIDNFLHDQDEELSNQFKHQEQAKSVIEQFNLYPQAKKVYSSTDVINSQKIIKKQIINKSYRLPSFDLLTDNVNLERDYLAEKEYADQRAQAITKLFEEFKISAKVTNIAVGPTITKYEISLQPGTKVSSVISHESDLKYALGSQNIRLEAPIPGKSAVGIEVANKKSIPVPFKTVISNTPLSKVNSKLLFTIGKDVAGDNLFAELNKMPHLLTAGSTGSGKSVMINCLISSILMRAKPHEVKFIMIDPKKVELDPYAKIPHLLTPVITDMDKACFVLQKVVKEMDDRYNLFKDSETKNIESYNEKQKDETLKLPYIVVVIDELADLMMQADKVEVENAIRRITQMARAAGIHLIVATQRPSTDVITGVVKSNIPSRIAFAVTSGLDSRTILDKTGAEKLIGKGDLLYIPPGKSALIRAQGAYISDVEIHAIVKHCANQQAQVFDEEFNEPIASYKFDQNGAGTVKDQLFEEVRSYVIREQKASTSLLQRKFSIGYNKAAKLIDELEDMGVIGPQNGSKPREVFIKEE